MRQRRIILVLLLVTLFGVGGYFLLKPPGEPIYEDQPLSYWLQCCARQLSVNGTNTSLEPQRAIRHLGSNNIPLFLKYVRYQPPGWFTSTSRWCQSLQRIDFFSDPVQEKLIRAEGAARAFAVLGSNAACAIPELNRMLVQLRKNDEPHAAVALAGIGEKALPALCAALTNRQLNCREGVAFTLAQIGPNARPALPLLMACVQDPDEAVASQAVLALGILKLEPDVVLPLITAKLSDTRAHVRLSAANALRVFGPQASNAIPALLKARNDPEVMVSSAASTAIWCIDSNALPRPKKP